MLGSSFAASSCLSGDPYSFNVNFTEPHLSIRKYGFHALATCLCTNTVEPLLSGLLRCGHLPLPDIINNRVVFALFVFVKSIWAWHPVWSCARAWRLSHYTLCYIISFLFHWLPLLEGNGPCLLWRKSSK